MYSTLSFFVESLDLSNHPIRNANRRVRAEYYTALSYIVREVSKSVTEQTCSDGKTVETFLPADWNQFAKKRLRSYLVAFSLEDGDIQISGKDALKCVTMCVSPPWRKKYRLWLMCDAALILLEPDRIQQAAQLIKIHLSKKQCEALDSLVFSFYHSDADISKHLAAQYLIAQCRKNFSFLQLPERRIIVTANVSAGKSTLINALIGEPITRTSQEVCTGSVCYIYNKPFEDNRVHLTAPKLTLCADAEALTHYQWNGEIAIASHFASIEPRNERICLIDTPGVNSSLHPKHGDITRSALLNQDYERVIYIIKPTNLGTDAEMRYLTWIACHIPKEKVVFVLNQLDEYHDGVDNIEGSIARLRIDLIQLGFENPVICPISAYFALLLKMKFSGQNLSEDEQDDYTLLAKKFRRDAYDLSKFYDGVQCDPLDSEEVFLSKKSGLYGLENILYGGLL